MRKPKSETPLRQLRLATGRSQKEFAAYLGLNFDLYHSLELGRARLTLKNAISIAQKTGAIAESLNPESSQLALNVDGNPYTRDSWEGWQNGHSLCPWERVLNLLEWTAFLCKIAEREAKLEQVCFDLCDCLTKTKDKFDLSNIVHHELTITKARKGILYKGNDLRNNKELARQVGFNENESNLNLLDDEVSCAMISYTPKWTPHSLLPPELAIRFALKQLERS